METKKTSQKPPLLAIWFLLVATMCTAQPPIKNPTPNSSAGNHTVGRYQIFFGPHARADQYLVDTETGRVWQKVEYPDLKGEPEVWMPLTRIDSDLEFNEWLKTQQSKPKPDAK
jgi:hypothetical protein